MSPTGPRNDTHAPGLLTLEGTWSSDLTATESVRPLSDLLRVTGHASHTPVRDVTDTADLRRHLTQWLEHDPDQWPVLYVACHGGPGTLQLVEDDDTTQVTLEDLADHIGDDAAGRRILLGACQVADVDPARLRRFCRRTGIDGVLGYTTAVDWTKSAALDLLVLSELLTGSSVRTAYGRLTRENTTTTTALGLRAATGTWVSA